MKYLLTIFLMSAIWSGAAAEYVPSGPRSFYNADVDSSKYATGGPLRNYHSDGQWRQINPDFRVKGGWLVSDSGQHSVGANLSTNVVWVEWEGHYLGLEVAPLYAYRKSTGVRIKLADPSFTQRSFDGPFIRITNIYPNVDLEIRNEPTSVQHRFIFSQSARDAFGIWWQNNGSHEDIYIVNSLKLHTDSLNLPVSVDLSVDQDIDRVNFGDLFGLSRRRMYHENGNHTDTVYKRIVNISGSHYLLEGFKWTTIKDWSDGDIFHYLVLGSDGDYTEELQFGGSLHAVVFIDTSGVAGTATAVWVRGRGDNDEVNVGLYADNAGSPAALISFATIHIDGAGPLEWHTAAYTETIDATTVYWILIQNNTASSVIVAYDGPVSTARDGTKNAYEDPAPPTDPQSGGTIQSRTNNNRACYIEYTAAGGAADISYVRRVKENQR